MLKGPLPALNDAEGARLPEALPPVIDAHVHLFPDGVFDALWRWFETHAWPIRYPLKSPAIIDFLLSRGVEQIVALHYPHKAGMADHLNRYVSELANKHPEVTAMASVYPGEDDTKGILERAFSLGLKGVKLHCHVQAFAPDHPDLEEVYEACVAHDLPLVMHAGRAPSSPAYPVDPFEICSVDRTEAVLRSYPNLRLCIPHLGADELDGYLRLLERYDNLWLDTTMVIGGYFETNAPHRFVDARPERIMYGTDFPNLPYAWDREIKILSQKHKEDALAKVLSETARSFFRLGAS